MKRKIFRIPLTLFLIMIFEGAISGQSVNQIDITGRDSLGMSDVLKQVLSTHPSVREAEEVINMADAQVQLARAAYLPVVDLNASYSRVEPVEKFTFPGFGTFQLMPQDNYSGSVTAKQMIYDFGKTSKRIGYENGNKELAAENLTVVRQKLTMLTVNAYYSLVFLTEAIGIKDMELKSLHELKSVVEKKHISGTATSYELLSTEVKISSTESQKSDLESMLKIQQTVINMLMGLPAGNNVLTSRHIVYQNLDVQSDSLLSFAFTHRSEITVAQEKEKVAQLQYRMIKAQNNPVLSAFVTGGSKNGYISDLNKLKANYTAGIGLSIPLFDANRTKYNLLQVKYAINNAGYEEDLARRNVTREVVEAQTNCITAQKKIDQFRLQLKMAEQVFDLAKVNFSVGAITNLDLLNAETTVSESRLQLLKSQVDYAVDVYSLRVALGIPVKSDIKE